MNKTATIGIIALVLGVGAIGLGIYQIWPSEPAIQPGVRHTWFARDLYNSTTSGSHRDLGNLSISIGLDGGESIYALFTASVRRTGGSGNSYVHVLIWVSNATWSNVYDGVECYNDTWHSCSCQALISGLPAGTYSVRVV